MSKKKDFTIASRKKDKKEMISIPDVWAGKFFGYTLFEIQQFIDFGKSKNFIPTKTIFDRD